MNSIDLEKQLYQEASYAEDLIGQVKIYINEQKWTIVADLSCDVARSIKEIQRLTKLIKGKR